MSEQDDDRGTGRAMTRRTGEDGSQLVVADAGSSAIVEAAVANVQARYALARRFPRNIDNVRAEVLRDCKRPSFAETAIYVVPRGKDVSGLSIRFVETALASMGNMDSSRFVISDDAHQRVVRVSVVDMEKNTVYQEDVVIDKTVERKSLRNGQRPLSSRPNSYGELVYLLPAGDDDVTMKESNLCAKALRRQGLKLIPSWLQHEAREQLDRTRSDEAARDPDGERRKLSDAFFNTHGVRPSDLEEYLGHAASQITTAELVELRGLFVALNESEVTWADALRGKKIDRGEIKPEEDKPSAQTQQAQQATAKVRGAAEKVRMKSQRAAGPAPAPAPPTQAIVDAVLAAARANESASDADIASQVGQGLTSAVVADILAQHNQR